MMEAALYNCASIVELLLANAADVNVRDNRVMTVFKSVSSIYATRLCLCVQARSSTVSVTCARLQRLLSKSNMMQKLVTQHSVVCTRYFDTRYCMVNRCCQLLRCASA